jgi:hypothetical protein
MTRAVAKTGPAAGIGRPKISPLSVMINLGHQTRIRLACRTVVMLQTMRARLAAKAMIISGPVGALVSLSLVIIVRSMIMHNMAMAMVAATARLGPVSGSQRIRRPVVASVPPAVTIATAISGMTGMAVRSAIRPVRHGLG